MRMEASAHLTRRIRIKINRNQTNEEVRMSTGSHILLTLNLFCSPSNSFGFGMDYRQGIDTPRAPEEVFLLISASNIPWHNGWKSRQESMVRYTYHTCGLGRRKCTKNTRLCDIVSKLCYATRYKKWGHSIHNLVFKQES